MQQSQKGTLVIFTVLCSSTIPSGPLWFYLISMWLRLMAAFIIIYFIFFLHTVTNLFMALLCQTYWQECEDGVTFWCCLQGGSTYLDNVLDIHCRVSQQHSLPSWQAWEMWGNWNVSGYSLQCVPDDPHSKSQKVFEKCCRSSSISFFKQNLCKLLSHSIRKGPEGLLWCLSLHFTWVQSELNFLQFSSQK